jgi:hypothetical protein
VLIEAAIGMDQFAFVFTIYDIYDIMIFILNTVKMSYEKN